MHPNVRLANIVFPVDGNSKLIDFDLAACVSKPYLTGYSDSCIERHQQAKEGEPNSLISLFSYESECQKSAI